MHDTAFEIGGLAIENYCPSTGAEILEIGSLDVNGSLRKHNINCKRYIGLDFSPGEGVDYVISNDYEWPVEDDSFDLVLASSVFEHDATFWQTFIVMARKVRSGGYIYINAPANGWIHRFPLDCWRFYPDCGTALVKWANAQGVSLTLIESFTADRRADVWNDWCGIFRREPAITELPERLISDQINCRNVITWKSPEITRFDERPEDMQVIEFERAARVQAEARLDQLAAESNTAAEALTEEIKQTKRLLEEAHRASTELEDARNKALLVATQTEKSLLQAKNVIVREIARGAKLAAQLAQTEQLANQLETQLKAAHLERDIMASDLSRASRDKRAVSERLQHATFELSKLAQLLRESVADQTLQAAHSAWMDELLTVIRTPPAWLALLPPRFRIRWLAAALRRRGLFDYDGYLQRYPDVAQAQMDPLDHYLKHGRFEGRLKFAPES